MMLSQVLEFLIENVARFFMLLLILRFLMQAVRVPFQQPLGQFVLAMTNWLVLRLRRITRGVHGYDVASLLGVVLTGFLLHLLLYLLRDTVTTLAEPSVWLTLLAWGTLELISMTLYCLFGALIIQAILSWTNPGHPFAGHFRRLTDPMLAPLRRLIPPVAQVDLTPLVMMLLLQLLLQFPVYWLATYLDKALLIGL